MFAVGLLVVACKMLHGCGDVLRLDATHHGRAHFAGEQRIFRIVFKISSAERIAVNVDRRCQPYGDIVLFYFLGACGSDLLNQGRVPGGGEQCGAWPCRCADLTLRGDAQTGRTVGGHDIWNAVFRKIAVAVGIRDRGIRLAAEQMNQIIVVQLGGKFIQGNLSLVNIDQRMCVFFIGIQQKVGCAPACCRGECFLGARYHFFKNTGIRIVGSSLRKFFVASVCE